jgi:hypothetical protein
MWEEEQRVLHLTDNRDGEGLCSERRGLMSGSSDERESGERERRKDGSTNVMRLTDPQAEIE